MQQDINEYTPRPKKAGLFSLIGDVWGLGATVVGTIKAGVETIESTIHDAKTITSNMTGIAVDMSEDLRVDMGIESAINRAELQVEKAKVDARVKSILDTLDVDKEAE